MIEKSPYHLIQEDLKHDTWAMMVACIMLNLTSIKQVRPVFVNFLQKYPNAACASLADELELAEMLRPLGLYNRRAKTLIKLSKAYINGWNSINDLPGVGKYASDSFEIFVNGNIHVEPSDNKLRAYVEWARSKCEKDFSS